MAFPILMVTICLNALVLIAAYFHSPLLWLGIFTLALLALVIHDMKQTRHALWRNYPVLARGRWLMEEIRPFAQQYLIESETGGSPINRMFRNIVYQRAKNNRETVPFGTRVDTYKTGYEWIGHSISALHFNDVNCKPRVKIGSRHCTQPYEANILNISAMSFGSLSQNALLALNKGAKLGEFYHNTGEGGISPYHREHGADLVWQVGTGYFGCRTSDGKFDAAAFEKAARDPQVKMIEIKLSQGAKPGHGGILPASKNTIEIAEIRGVEPGVEVDSPPFHSAFSSPLELIEFIQSLRKLSGGKPIGFKLAIGRKSEFMAICKAMKQLDDGPDFITVDGGEGGTGAAPLEYTNSIGSPLREALAFVDDALRGFGLRDEIKLIASGKIISGFHLVKNLAIGADICNSARGMMLALGCVQSLSCNTNRCPTGVATQDPKLSKGLVPEDKYERVFNFQQKTVHAAVDILTSAGIRSPHEVNRTHIFRRVSQEQVKRYDQVFPMVESGSFLKGDIPERYQLDVAESSAHSFMPNVQLTEINEKPQAVS
ncbi:FMN-binding glutamate synthase family protein [Glaciecola siphonariae]|uniref:FMN-binding glutamate synthase family protein n=1 Tax=Glaciecola siphonariae TaxID=521012 RepID=A0ABV9M0N9_9ALTE